MRPSFSDGDFVVYLNRLFSLKPYKVGTLLIVDHPKYGIILKRVVELKDNVGYQLKSDNANGVGSKELGICKFESIKGKVIVHIRKNKD